MFNKKWYDGIKVSENDSRDLGIFEFTMYSYNRNFVDYCNKKKKTIHSLSETRRTIDNSEISVSDYVNELLKNDYTMVAENYTSQHDVEKLFVNAESLIKMSYCLDESLDDDFYVELKSMNKKYFDDLVNRFFNSTVKRKKDNEGKVYVLVQEYSGLNVNSIGVASVPLHYSNYSEKAQVGIKSVIQDLKSNLPTGKLTIIQGQPGTGKTTLVRSLITEVPNGMFIIIPPSMVAQLGDPSIIPVLMGVKESNEDRMTDEEKLNTNQDGKSEPIIFIVEDADHCLVERAGDNMNSISSILNATSGILGDMLDIRVIATTNAKVTTFDEAITRDGRLSFNLEVGELNGKEANRAYQRIMEDPNAKFTENENDSVILASVYKQAKLIKQGTMKDNIEVADAMLNQSGASSHKHPSSIDNTSSNRAKRKIGF